MNWSYGELMWISNVFYPHNHPTWGTDKRIFTLLCFWVTVSRRDVQKYRNCLVCPSIMQYISGNVAFNNLILSPVLRPLAILERAWLFYSGHWESHKCL